MLVANSPEQTIQASSETTTMKAMVCSKYGPPEVLELQDIEKPSPDDDQVLIRICAASVNAGDWHLMRADPCLVRLAFGLFKPKHKVLGADIAGRVEAVGKNIKQFREGDEVFGDISEYGFGAFAEYTCVNEDALILKPVSMSFKQAAAIPSAAVTALQGLRDNGEIQHGQKVLINGASGGVGSFAVQIAKSFCADVTAVCSTRKLEKVRKTGADQIIDYSLNDFTRNDQSYDLIFAVNGYHCISDYERSLSPQGIYVTSGGSMAQLFQAMLLGPLLSRKGGKKLGNFLVKPNKKDLQFIADLFEAGKVLPVIDRCYPLSEVANAIRYLEGGNAHGKVVITMGE